MLDVGYAGLDAGTAFEQYLTPLGSHVGGLNFGATVSYSLPVGNRTARGGVARQASIYRQQTTLAQDLDRVIHSSVLVALKALERSIYELKSSEAAVTLYRTAVLNEKKKFQMGLATLIDVINVEDRLTRSIYRQQTTLAQDLDRVIHSSVLVALKALERSIYELKSSEAAVTLYRTAVLNEKKKFQMRLATLIDVINVEDRLTDVRYCSMSAMPGSMRAPPSSNT